VPAGLIEAEVKQAERRTGGSPQARWNKVIAACLHGHNNVGRAAVLVNLSSYELDEGFRRLPVLRRIGHNTEAEAQAEVRTAFHKME
jgi:hypothetical protein